jgi:hypothetical protein
VRTPRLVGLAALVAALALGLAACGGDDGDGASAATSTVPICTAKAPGADRPDGFPADLPLPAAFVVTGSEQRSEGRVVLDGVATDDFETTLHFLQRELPKAGYRLTEGEVEEHDAESNFSGHGLRGRWAIRVADGCRDRTTLEVVVQPS